MVKLFTECDADYGKRVAEGLKKQGKGESNTMDEAVNIAEEIAHPSDPY